MAKNAAPRPQTTREHVIASLSRNYVERFFIDRGHTVGYPADDYGYDALVNTFDIQGFAESGEILIQLKASDHLTYSARRDYVSFKISVKHYDLWIHEPMPVFLVLFDAELNKAYWLYVQAYFNSNRSRKPKATAKSISLRVPVANEFNHTTVDYAQARKQLVINQIEGRIGHHG